MSVQNELADKIEALAEEIKSAIPPSYERGQIIRKLDDMQEDMRATMGETCE